MERQRLTCSHSDGRRRGGKERLEQRDERLGWPMRKRFADAFEPLAFGGEQGVAHALNGVRRA